jgi:hypothetical protein
MGPWDEMAVKFTCKQVMKESFDYDDELYVLFGYLMNSMCRYTLLVES